MTMLPIRERDYAELLLARAALGGGTAQAGPLLRQAQTGTPGLSASGQLAMGRTLQTGLIRAFAQGGGARRETFGGRSGRLWERHAAPGP